MKSASVEVAHGMMRHASSYSIISFHASPLVGIQRGLLQIKKAANFGFLHCLCTHVEAAPSFSASLRRPRKGLAGILSSGNTPQTDSS